jgi:CheY-like chemotaxis protein
VKKADRDEPGSLTPEPNASGTRVRTALPRQRILIVDDEVLLLRVLARSLGADHEVVTVSNAHEALDLVARRDFDVLLVDMRLGDVWGGTLLEAVAEIRPDLREKVAFLTGGVGEPDIDAFFESVPNERLEKPFCTADLHALVARMVARSADR